MRLSALRALLHSLGFQERIKGDHFVYSRDAVTEIINIQPAILHEWLAQQNNAAGIDSEFMRQLEQLPYWLRGACAAVMQLETARCQALEEL